MPAQDISKPVALPYKANSCYARTAVELKIDDKMSGVVDIIQTYL